MPSEIGIDLGSYKTVIFSGSKVVLEHPSAVTVDAETYEPIFYGEKARLTIGRTPDTLICIPPIKKGVIADYDISEMMLKEYMNEAFGNKVLRPSIIATLPPGMTDLQHHSLSNVIEAAGGRSVTIIESPLAIAFGLDLDFSKPCGYLIVDFGAGTTDAAVVSMGGISESVSIKTGSLDIDEEIIKYVRKVFNIEIGALMAEKIKMNIASVSMRNVEVAMVAKGRNVFTGLPETFEITSEEIREVILSVIDVICTEIKKMLLKTDPDLIADIKESGMFLGGGGALLSGLQQHLSRTFDMKVNLIDDPAHCVVKGAAAALRNPESLKNINYQLRTLSELEIK